MNESTFSKVSERRVLKLRAACSRIYSGGTPDTSIKEYWTGNFPWLSSGETNNRFIKNTKNFISESGVKNSSTKLAKRGSSVIASAGQGHTRGQVSYLMIDTYINQSVIALFPDETILDSLFLFYSLNLKYERFRQISDDHSIRGSLTTKILGDEEISLPPLADQKVIAKILSDLDEKIELNNEMNKTFEEKAQAIFKRWFIDFEFPNENGDPYKSSGGEMVESELGMIPKGWYVDNLGKFVEVVKGCSYNSIDLKPSNTALVTLKSINRGGGFNKNGYKEYVGKYRDNQIVKEGDILLAQTDLTQNGDVIGRPAFFHGKTIYSKVIASLDLQIIRPSNGFSKYFVFYLLETDLFHEHALSYTNGTTVLHLDKNAVSEFRCIIPKNEILDLFDASISQILRLENNNLKEVNHLTEIRDLLLPKLMTGRIRVPMED